MNESENVTVPETMLCRCRSELRINNENKAFCELCNRFLVVENGQLFLDPEFHRLCPKCDDNMTNMGSTEYCPKCSNKSDPVPEKPVDKMIKDMTIPELELFLSTLLNNINDGSMTVKDAGYLLNRVSKDPVEIMQDELAEYLDVKRKKAEIGLGNNVITREEIELSLRYLDTMNQNLHKIQMGTDRMETLMEKFQR